MCRFMFLLLFIFAPGNTQLSVSPGCGSNYLAARERSGSIRYSLPPIHYNIPLVNQITENTESPLDFTCTWIIDAHENQTVWIDVLSVGRGASLGIRFGNEDRLVYDREQRALFTGTGRTSIEWSWRWSVKTSGALHIRWNTSEDSHVFALIPYTHSETDAVSPSPSGSSSVTYTPDIPGRGNVALNTQALRGQNVWQGGGVSDLADKNRPLYPQENTNNGEETAGAWISDLTHAGTDSYDTHTGRDTDSAANTHINTHSVFSHEPSLARSSTKIQSPSLSIHTTPRHSTDATAKTNTLSLLETNDVTRTEFDTLNTGNSYYRNTDTLTDILSGTLKVKRDDSISSTLPTFSLFSISPHNRDTNQEPFDVTTEQKDIFSVSPVEVHHQSVYNRDVSTISENVRTDQFDVKTLAITHENRPVESETNRVERSPRSTHPNLNITDQSYSASYDDLIISSTPAAVSEFPDFNQSNPVDFSGSKTIKYSSGSSDSTSGITQRPINVTVLSTENELTSSSETEDMLSTKQLTNDTHESYTTQPSTSLKPSTIHNSHTIQNQHNTSTQQTSSASPPSSSDISGLNTSSPFNSTDISDLNTSHDTNEVSTFIPFTAFTLPDQTSAQSSGTPEGDMNPSPYRSDCLNVTCISYLPTTARQDEKRQESLITSPPSISLSGSTGPQINPDVTSDLMNEGITTVRSENQTDFKESETSPSEIQKTHSHTNSPAETQPNTHAESEPPVDTPTPEFSSSPPHTTEDNVGFSAVTNITHTSYSGQTVDVVYSSPTQSSVTASSKTSLSLSPFNHIQTGSTENTDSTTAHNAETAGTDSTSPSSADITAPHISLSSSVSMIDHAAHTRTPVSMTTPHWDTSQTSTTPAITTPQSKLTRTTTKHLSLTSIEDPLVYLQTHVPMLQSSTTRPLQHTSTQPYLTPAKTHTISTQAVNQTSWVPPTSSRSDRDWPHRKHFFIVEDQPVIIKEKTFQILLQIVLEENFVPGMRLLEMEPFLRNISGYQSQHVTWHSGPVLQTVVLFQTAETFSWLGRMEFLLQEAGLNPLPKKGLFVGGVRVKNITVGGLQTDVCEWLFECPSGFQCDSSKGNASCKSVCHSDYCKHHGICVHRSGHQPLCQCPVGEDYWFMGPRCDLRMTRPRLVGVCFGVLAAVAAVMALLSYLAVRRFKSMLIQAKVDQTRSSYRKFNHFDELSARFWGRSWPGSEDSLDNPAFTRSDELLHLRALDRTCCYHDDSLSVVSTYHGSGTHLNTIYPHSSQYGWDLSNCSLADGVVDSGKASDLSVCSWPIEPIQWTPFPLLQQITRNTNTVKVSRPRSYCEGMELVDLEKSWTA